MPTESAPAHSGGGALPPPVALKCAICGAASLSPVDGVVILGDQIERFCAACFRQENALGLGLALGINDGGGGGGGSNNNNNTTTSSDGASGSSSRPSSVLAHARRSSDYEPVVLDLARIRDAAVAARRPRTTIMRSNHGRAPTPPSPLDEADGDADSTTAASPRSPHAVSRPSPVCIPLRPMAEEDEHNQRGVSASGGGCSAGAAKSLPATRPLPWATKPSPGPSTQAASSTSAVTADRLENERADNPLLDVTRARVKSLGRGCLYPGSVFKGTQTSGRSSYDVEIQIVNVDFTASTLCGYLSISHLTDSHPQLTTFFDGEIIGPKHGFITGERFGATEHDDMRHWGRFEQFRRPDTRQDIVRPEMLLRDPLPDMTHGDARAQERDHVFIRIKEKFLVPDHHVRDISGASFAGFYYAIVDFGPTLEVDDTPSSPTVPRSPLIGTGRRTSSSGPRPDPPRRQSSTTRAGIGAVSETAAAQSPTATRRASHSTTRPETPRRMSTQRAPSSKDATIRGYYFHSLNQEPFQELSLTHSPAASRTGGTFELC